MTVLGYVFLALSALVTVTNLVGAVQALRWKRRGDTRGYSWKGAFSSRMGMKMTFLALGALIAIVATHQRDHRPGR